MLAAFAIYAVGGTVADLRIGHEGVHVAQNEPVEVVVVYPATIQPQGRQGGGTGAGTCQTDCTGENVGIADLIIARTLALQIYTAPGTSSVEVRHGIKEIIQTITADENRRFPCALRMEIALHIDVRTLVHVYPRTGVNGQVTADEERVENDIRLLCGEPIVSCYLRTFTAASADTSGILSVSFQNDCLRVAGSKMEVYFVRNKNGTVAVQRFRADTYENQHTISAVYCEILQPRQIGFSVHIDFEQPPVVHPYAIYHHGVCVRVINHQLHRGTALFCENGVKTYSILRERQSQ